MSVKDNDARFHIEHIRNHLYWMTIWLNDVSDRWEDLPHKTSAVILHSRINDALECTDRMLESWPK